MRRQPPIGETIEIRTNATINETVTSNMAIYSNQSDATMVGFESLVSDGSLEANVINNSVVGASPGFNFRQAHGATYDINFYNNLIAYSGRSVVIRSPTIADINGNIAFDNDYNLFYQNNSTDPDFVAGHNFISSNPMTKGLTNSRLKPGYPAIEAAYSEYLLLAGSVRFIDADGLYRLKNDNPGTSGISLDTGAYEAGDVIVLDTYQGCGSHINNIESSVINSQANAKLHVTQNWSPDGATGIYNNSSVGIWRNGSLWTI